LHERVSSFSLRQFATDAPFLLSVIYTAASGRRLDFPQNGSTRCTPFRLRFLSGPFSLGRGEASLGKENSSPRSLSTQPLRVLSSSTQILLPTSDDHALRANKDILFF